MSEHGSLPHNGSLNHNTSLKRKRRRAAHPPPDAQWQPEARAKESSAPTAVLTAIRNAYRRREVS